VSEGGLRFLEEVLWKVSRIFPKFSEHPRNLNTEPETGLAGISVQMNLVIYSWQVNPIPKNNRGLEQSRFSMRGLRFGF
jgi:hypothetical protein